MCPFIYDPSGSCSSWSSTQRIPSFLNSFFPPQPKLRCSTWKSNGFTPGAQPISSTSLCFSSEPFSGVILHQALTYTSIHFSLLISGRTCCCIMQKFMEILIPQHSQKQRHRYLDSNYKNYVLLEAWSPSGDLDKSDFGRWEMASPLMRSQHVEELPEEALSGVSGFPSCFQDS